MARKLLPGHPFPLGASWDGTGTNFSLFSENATAVELCLFDENGQEERLSLREVTAHIWHACLPGVGPGQLYGYRVHGPYEPEAGHRFNAAKLLVDPYAKAISGQVDWRAPVFGYELGHPDEDLSLDTRDSAWGVPKGVVIDDGFDWEGDRPPQIPWHRSIIYETHVKGLTIRHPDVPEPVRGTYAGLASPAMIEYLQRLGVTAVELLPVHDILDDKRLVDMGLRNYWGYNTLNYFAPDARYAAAGGRGEQVSEFKRMVRELHKAGIEVILDVVYNHTAEGSELGPTLSFRGIDNVTYYRLKPDDPRRYADYTGTGNTLNTVHPQVLRLLMDSLRYWVLDMHVDGFRFDLAATLARELHDVDRLGSFFDVIHQDPVLSQVKLIAEPWDVGEGGYQVGNFPVLWAEWNDKYRDTARRFWRGDPDQMAELGYRLTGSSDLYQGDGRKPSASINFVTAHDGFTLRDLVSYEHKHNEANGEDNRDGHSGNLSANYGVEGPTDDAEIRAVRARQQRNLLATLLFSQGVPMLLGGDELGRTQGGNNNAYCQDNEISWYDWDLGEEERALLDFTRRIIQLRKEHPVLRRRKFFQGRPIHGSRIDDLSWFRPDGKQMAEAEWDKEWVRTVGLRLSGEALDEIDSRGERVTDDTLLILLNAHVEPIPFTLPASHAEIRWQVLLDTRAAEPPEPRVLHGGEVVELEARSVMLLRRPRTPGGD